MEGKERQRDIGRKNSAQQILGNMLKDKHGSFALKHSKTKYFSHVFIKGLEKQHHINQLQSFRLVLSFCSNSQVLSFASS